jgi:hypothetical protein
MHMNGRVSEEYPILIEACLNFYSHQPQFARQAIPELDLLCKNKVKLNLDIVPLSKIVGSVHVELAKNNLKAIKGQDLQSIIKLIKYLKM